MGRHRKRSSLTPVVAIGAIASVAALVTGYLVAPEFLGQGEASMATVSAPSAGPFTERESRVPRLTAPRTTPVEPSQRESATTTAPEPTTDPEPPVTTAQERSETPEPAPEIVVAEEADTETSEPETSDTETSEPETSEPETSEPETESRPEPPAPEPILEVVTGSCPDSGFDGVQPHVAQAGHHLQGTFGVGTVGGVAGRSRTSDHPSGYALDFMVGRETGDSLSAYALDNFGDLNIKYVIWRQRINHGSGWEGMEDRGGDTANHYDHVHISMINNPNGPFPFKC